MTNFINNNQPYQSRQFYRPDIPPRWHSFAPTPIVDVFTFVNKYTFRRIGVFVDKSSIRRSRAFDKSAIIHGSHFENGSSMFTILKDGVEVGGGICPGLGAFKGLAIENYNYVKTSYWQQNNCMNHTSRFVYKSAK